MKKNADIKSVVLYEIESDFPTVAARLVEKLYSRDERALILASNDDEAALIDAKLWTFSQLSFIPHGSERSLCLEDAPLCHTWISANITHANSPTCLIHNGIDLPKRDIQAFVKIIDIFGKTADPAAFRDRCKMYKNCNFSDMKLWSQNCGKWEDKTGELAIS